MPANPSPKRPRAGSTGRTTPKGTRPPGAVGRPSLREAAAVDHHLGATPPQRLHGRPAPPNALRQRSGHRGGR